jgi:CBS domain-containing protein
MRARDIMTTPVITVRPETPVKHVAHRLVENEIHAMPVEDAEGSLLGIVTEADLLRMQATAGTGEVLLSSPHEETPPGAVAEIMTRDVVAVHEEADVADVLRVMVERQLKTLPVVAGRRLVGVIGRRDILRLMARDDATVHDEVQRVLDLVGEDPFSVDVVEGVVTVNRWLSPAAQERIARLIKTVPGAVSVRFKQ